MRSHIVWMWGHWDLVLDRTWGMREKEESVMPGFQLGTWEHRGRRNPGEDGVLSLRQAQFELGTMGTIGLGEGCSGACILCEWHSLALGDMVAWRCPAG